MNCRREKCTDDIRVWLGETLRNDLKVLAAKHGFDSLSPFIRKILREFVYGHYGHGNEQRDLLAGTVRDE
jgi:metal-responsive CopG/Arc/MetJ family transcriptional regulator